MNRISLWIEKYAGKLLLLFGLFILASGIVGHINGVKTGLAPDGRYPGKIYQTSVWFLDFIALFAIVIGVIMLLKQIEKKSP